MLKKFTRFIIAVQNLETDDRHIIHDFIVQSEKACQKGTHQIVLKNIEYINDGFYRLKQCLQQEARLILCFKDESPHLSRHIDVMIQNVDHQKKEIILTY